MQRFASRDLPNLFVTWLVLVPTLLAARIVLAGGGAYGPAPSAGTRVEVSVP